MGSASNERANSILQTIDGGYIVAGKAWIFVKENCYENYYGCYCFNVGHDDYWIIKLDELGNMEWEKYFGGNNDDVAISIQQTIDGGYIVAGNSWLDE